MKYNNTNIQKRILTDISEHLTLQEKKADFLERNITERACSIYLKKIKKKKFVGIVDGIERYGIFIKCVDYPFTAYQKKKAYSYGQLYLDNYSINNYKKEFVSDSKSIIFDNKSKKKLGKNNQNIDKIIKNII